MRTKTKRPSNTIGARWQFPKTDPRTLAALAAFDEMVADIDGATVRGQSLVVDGRVFIDLTDYAEAA